MNFCRLEVATKPFWMLLAFCSSWFTWSSGEPTSGVVEDGLPRKTWTELASWDAEVAGSGTTTFCSRSPVIKMDVGGSSLVFEVKNTESTDKHDTKSY